MSLDTARYEESQRRNQCYGPLGADILGANDPEAMDLSSALPVSVRSAEENGARRRVDMPGTHSRQAISAAHVGDTIIVVFIVLGRKNCGETGPARVTGRR